MDDFASRVTASADGSAGANVGASVDGAPERLVPTTPRTRLRSPQQRGVAREWDNELYRSLAGSWRLMGPAGSGVSTLIMDSVAKLLKQGTPAEEILVLAPGKDAASRLRAGIADRVSGMDFASAATMVRSVPSLAFALLRLQSDPTLRLITGAEQDALMQELLALEAEEGAQGWPDSPEALSMRGYARGVRDFILRAVERGLGPEELGQLGEDLGRPRWVAAANFLRSYEATMSLADYNNFSAAELVSAVLAEELPSTPWRAIFVDDAQNLDPKSGELVARLVAGLPLAVIAGAPEHSVFRFRGARPEFLTEFPAAHELILEGSHRAPEVSGRILASPGAQSEFVADVLRREHLLGGVDYQDMAVITRGVGEIPQIRRALLAAGVPVQLDPTDLVLAEEPIVSALLLAIRSLRTQPTLTEMEDLALGAVGGADPVTLRRLLRGLRKVEMAKGGQRRALEVLRDLVLPGAPSEDHRELEAAVKAVLTDREQSILERISSVLAAGNTAMREGLSVEEVLWAVWEATGLSEHLLATSLRGGAAGSQADRSLDAMMSLFDAAGDFAERRPTAGIEAFIEHIDSQELPTGVRDRRLITPDAVSILTAHASLGREWKVVCVVGVQEGNWPSLGETGSLFGQEELTDYLDEGIIPGTPIARSTERLREEERLFHVATTRATERLVVTAVSSEDAKDQLEPSRFLREIPQMVDETSPEFEQQAREALPESERDLELPTFVRLLSVPSVVAELRRHVADEEAPLRHRKQAARQLARLAAAGVPGAHPDSWWGAQGTSEAEPLETTRISPSTLEKALDCPLRASLDKVRLASENTEPMMKGNLAHAFAEAFANGVPAEEALEAVRAGYAAILSGPAWRREAALRSWDEMMSKLYRWLEAAKQFELVGVEVPVNVDLGGGVEISGRIDRLDKSSEGRYRIVDIKSGSSTPTQEQTDENKQLFAYQLALHRGRLAEGPAVVSGEGLPVENAVLVYPSTKNKQAATRVQAPKSEEELAELLERLPEVVAQMRGPQFLARENAGCSNCTYRVLCPVQAEGRMTPEP